MRLIIFLTIQTAMVIQTRKHLELEELWLWSLNSVPDITMSKKIKIGQGEGLSHGPRGRLVHSSVKFHSWVRQAFQLQFLSFTSAVTTTLVAKVFYFTFENIISFSPLMAVLTLQVINNKKGASYNAETRLPELQYKQWIGQSMWR